MFRIFPVQLLAEHLYESSWKTKKRVKHQLYEEHQRSNGSLSSLAGPPTPMSAHNRTEDPFLGPQDDEITFLGPEVDGIPQVSAQRISIPFERPQFFPLPSPLSLSTLLHRLAPDPHAATPCGPRASSTSRCSAASAWPPSCLRRGGPGTPRSIPSWLSSPWRCCAAVPARAKCLR